MTGTPAGEARLRASDTDRDRTVRALRESAVEGRLTHESFVHRVDLALRAKDQGALEDLLADLPRRLSTAAAPRAGWTRLRSRAASFTMLLPAGSRGAHLPVLSLPGPHQPVLTIGRDRSCDLVLADTTVSRLHAVLRKFGDEWFVEDLGSTNGTRLNEIRVRAATVVRPGDRLGLGGTAFRVQRPRP